MNDRHEKSVGAASCMLAVLTRLPTYNERIAAGLLQRRESQQLVIPTFFPF